MESVTSLAWMEDDSRITIVSSTQIPHIVRRVVGQALNIPWSCVRVIKPFVGGGFGNKQDVLEEPMAAFLTSKLGGIPVKVSLVVKNVSSQPVPATLSLLTGKWA